MSEALCIIPARGGSKRIPKKNIKNFHGKPIIAYTINTALKSGLFDEVMVSTDCENIKTISEKYGASVPFMRSDVTSNDTASTISVIREVIAEYKRNGKEFEYVCCFYPTAPLVKVSDLTNGLKLLINNPCDTVLPIVKFSYPVWRGLRQNSKGQIKLIWSEFLNSRSQDLEPVFHDAGQWYWIKAKSIHLETFESECLGIVLNEEEVQDIDNESDWTIAEMKYQVHLSNLK